MLERGKTQFAARWHDAIHLLSSRLENLIATPAPIAHIVNRFAATKYERIRQGGRRRQRRSLGELIAENRKRQGVERSNRTRAGEHAEHLDGCAATLTFSARILSRRCGRFLDETHFD